MDVGARKGPGKSEGPGADLELRKMRTSSVARGQGRREVKWW